MMGIRGLTKHLLPFAEWSVLGESAPDQPGSLCHEVRNIVIDGPSLAFFIYRRLLAHNYDGSNIIDSMPSYNMLGRTAVAFLQQLQDCGLIIDHIYFDGYLPEHKIETRQKRLEKAITELFKFRASHPNGFPFFPFTLSTSATNNPDEGQAFSLQDILRSNPQSHTTRNSPSPPFLVPAVIHALRASEFKCTVELVPGEADPYCAARAREIHGLVITTDSDLLIHDLGPGGCVTLLDHIQLEAQVEPGTTLKAPIFEPCKTSQRLGIGNDVQALQSLAYFLQEMPGISFHQALQKVRAHKERGAELAHEIIPLFNPSSQTLQRHEAALFDDAHLNYFKLHGQHLDPRLAEVCLQHCLKAKPTEHAMYLPMLLEDPARASAWEVSVPIRQLAYTHLVQRSSCASMLSSIFEYRRKGRRLVRTPLCTSESEEQSVGNVFSLVCNQLDDIYKSFADIAPTSLRWRYVAARFVLEWCGREAKTLPSIATVKHFVLGNSQSKRSWDDIHFAAQAESVLYSMHMIRQVFQYLQSDLLECKTTCKVDGLAKSTVRIAQTMIDLPAFEKLLLSTKEIKCLSDSAGYETPEQELRRRIFPVS